MAGADGVLIDIDGVLTQSWRPISGAVEAFARLREHYAVKLVTNTTSRSRAWIAETLADAGFGTTPEDIVTAPSATVAYLAEHHPDARCLLLNSGDIADDLADLHLVSEQPDVVVFGGAGPEFSYEALNTAFGHLQDGVPLVAMQRNLYWRTDNGLELDSGAFLVGLEQAAQVDAVVVGKPSADFFASALSSLGSAAGEAVMVGDDIESDVLAAQDVGITGVLVKTGKYLAETHRAARAEPHHVIDSFADLPKLLEDFD